VVDGPRVRRRQHGPPRRRERRLLPRSPVDTHQDIRNAISLALEQQGVEVEVFHHEVAAPGQNEIGTKFNSLVKRADWMQILKYTVWMVSASYGKTATFMPKPVVGDNGSGMHVHQSVWKDGKNLFAGNGYAGLSDFALYYIGGIIKHAKALNAITNPGPTAISGWFRASRRRSTWRTPRVTARRPAVFRSSRATRRAASRCASRIRRRIRISPSRRC